PTSAPRSPSSRPSMALLSIGRSGVIDSFTFSMISVWVMKSTRFSLSKSDFLGSPMVAVVRSSSLQVVKSSSRRVAAYRLDDSTSSRPRLPRRDRLLHHLLVDGQSAVGLGFEFEVADDAAVDLAQGAGAEAALARGVPGDG